jgi:hypothetical protein
MLMKNLLLIALLIGLTACDKVTKSGITAMMTGFSVSGQWKVLTYETVSDPTAHANQHAWGVQELFFREDRIFCFFDDKQYVQASESHLYEKGTYTFNGAKLTLSPANGAPEEVTVTKRDDNYMWWLVSLDGRYVLAKLGRVEEPLARPDKDPHHPNQNLWRIKPSAPETDEQLRTRMRQHLVNTKAVLEAGQERDSRTYSWKYTPSCIHILRGGVDVRYDEQIEGTFYDYFYNKAQAARGIQMLQEAFAKVPRKDIHLDKWVQNDIDYINEVLKTF